jgi:hypothetical protein
LNKNIAEVGLTQEPGPFRPMNYSVVRISFNPLCKDKVILLEFLHVETENLQADLLLVETMKVAFLQGVFRVPDKRGQCKHCNI